MYYLEVHESQWIWRKYGCHFFFFFFVFVEQKFLVPEKKPNGQ